MKTLEQNQQNSGILKYDMQTTELLVVFLYIFTDHDIPFT